MMMMMFAIMMVVVMCSQVCGSPLQRLRGAGALFAALHGNGGGRCDGVTMDVALRLQRARYQQAPTHFTVY